MENEPLGDRRPADQQRDRDHDPHVDQRVRRDLAEHERQPDETEPEQHPLEPEQLVGLPLGGAIVAGGVGRAGPMSRRTLRRPAVARHGSIGPRARAAGVAVAPRCREEGTRPHDPDDPVPRAHVGAQRDGPVEPLGGPPGGGEVPAVGEVRVLRRPQRRGPVRHLPAVQVPILGRGRRAVPRRRPGPRPARLKPGEAQYTIWCDDRGFLVEDGVLLRHAGDEFVLTAAEPNLAWFADQVGPRDDVTIEDVSDDWAVLSLQGPRAKSAARRPRQAASRSSPTSSTATAKIGGKAVTVSRTGYTGDLGYEVWCRAEDALPVWDAVWARPAATACCRSGCRRCT